ncbi:MAG: GGDEF domain-containing protein, partial [Eubacteriales bacterium]|nr:GGDEF domain-containing protein [Eubacteriales bacterium]
STGQRLFEEVVNSNEDIQTAAVIMFDLDSLKEVNDNHGHNFGDAYIRESGRRFKTVKSAGKSILSRRSGDEFLLFLYQYPDKDTVRKEMDDFFAKLKEIPMPLPNGDVIYISMSAGLVWFEDTRDNYEELINKADSLMYKAKKTRKGTLME